MAEPGVVRQGLAWQGIETPPSLGGVRWGWPPTADEIGQRGKARLGWVWLGTVRSGKEGLGLARHGIRI